MTPEWKDFLVTGFLWGSMTGFFLGMIFGVAISPSEPNEPAKKKGAKRHGKA